MTAEIHNIRDYQSKRALARMEADLNRQAVEIDNIAFPSVFGFADAFNEPHTIDATQANAFHQPKDPA